VEREGDPRHARRSHGRRPQTGAAGEWTSARRAAPGGCRADGRRRPGAGGRGRVGLGTKLRLDDALAPIGEVAALLRRRFDPSMPTRATVEFGVSFSAEGGKLTSLLFEGKGEASLTVTLGWERHADTPP
jgi:hypothetical protein